MRGLLALLIVVTLVAGTSGFFYPTHLSGNINVSIDDEGVPHYRERESMMSRTAGGTGWQNADNDHSTQCPSKVGSTQDCNRVQMIQFVTAYGTGTYDYDFTPTFPFYNVTTVDAFFLRLIDVYYYHGGEFFKFILSFYAPWFNQAYEVVQPHLPYDMVIDDRNCVASLVIKRDLRMFSDLDKADTQWNKANFYFGNNRRNGQNGFNRPYNWQPNEIPDVLVNYITEEVNNERMGKHAFSRVAQPAESFCNDYVEHCSTPFAGLVDWANHTACMAYMSTIQYSINPYNTLNPAQGDTVNCRNFFAVYRIGANYFNETAEVKHLRCLFAGPSSIGGNPNPLAQCQPAVYDGA